MANVSQCAETNQTYCTNYDNYPTEFIEEFLQKHLHKYAVVFGSDMISTEIITRNNADEEITLCDSYEEVIYPQVGKNQNGIDLFIVNTEEFKQGVRISRCRDRGEQCNKMGDSLFGYRTECKQHFVYRELLSFRPDGTTIMKEKYEFPACCSCAAYRDFN